MRNYDQTRGDQLVEHLAALGSPLEDIARTLRITPESVVSNHWDALQRGVKEAGDRAVRDAMASLTARGLAR